MDYSNSNLLDERKIISIFDTTLRDGEQSPGCTMYFGEKIEVAKSLEKLGVDVIEAGFAVSSEDSYETIREICRNISRPIVCSMARCLETDIVRAYGALKDYDKRMVHLFISTSKIHMEKKLGKTEKEVLEMARNSVRRAKDLFPYIEFTAEDTTRTEEKFLEEVYETVLSEGANVINVADTVGYSEPEDFGKLVGRFSKFVKKIKPEAIVSVHCHNDLGLAIANTLAGIKNGADRVECTINGIGERAGNCALEAIVGNSLVKKTFTTNINSKYLYEISKLVKKVTGTRNDFAAITGSGAFVHKSGIHQHGVANDSSSYEILIPKELGMQSRIEIGPQSGIHGVLKKAEQLGFNIDDEKARKVLGIVYDLVRNGVQKNFNNEDIVRFINEVK
jgi:2-isopropylmalate synthase